MFTIFFFNDTATTEIYTLSLHDALPISFRGSLTKSYAFGATAPNAGGRRQDGSGASGAQTKIKSPREAKPWPAHRARSEEHTSELQSQSNLVCRLLLEKKKKNIRKGDYS